MCVCVCVWYDVWHSFLLVWVRASQKIPLSVLARNTHKGLAREISYETGRRRGKAKSQSSQQQSTEEGSQQKSGKAAVREGRWLSEELEPVDPEAGLAKARGWVNVPGGCVGISLRYTLAIAHRCTRKSHKSVTNISLLALGANQNPCLFVLLFFLPLGCICCVLCVCKAMLDTPGRRWEKPLDNRMSWFRRLR